jgi:protein-S-isoprenylcysteine O-methyltransferase Ste14
MLKRQIAMLRQSVRHHTLLDWIGCGLWSIFATLHLQRALTGQGYWWFSLGLFLFYALVATFMLARSPARANAGRHVTALAWLSATLPLAGLVANGRGWLIPAIAVQGVGLVGLLGSIVALGRRFSIAPADRGLVTGGFYRLVRHPLYASELLFNVGFIIANPSWRNAAIMLLMLISQVVRIRHEEAILSNYDTYAHQVRWRLLPGLW